MYREKHGKVILPFLSENQLEGFCRQESKNLDILLFKQQWTDKQEALNKLQPSVQFCEHKEMDEPDKERYFLSDPSFQENYQGRQVSPIWLKNFDQVIPLKPFIAVENCEELSEKYLREGFESICVKKTDKKYNVQFNVSQQDNVQLSMITEDRSIHVKGINIKKDEASGNIKFEVYVGRPSHFIEIFLQEGRYYLLNGLHRLYTLLKNNYEGPIPCLLIDQNHENPIVHPYQPSLFTGKRPPILKDFLNEELLYQFELQTGMKHIQLMTQDNLIPTWS